MQDHLNPETLPLAGIVQLVTLPGLSQIGHSP
jgi:hypothetical protein